MNERRTLELFQVDAFARRPFEGNPAAVCPLDAWLDEPLMQSIAAENNLSETAFLVRGGAAADWELRWFTPRAEVDLCGHATLASGWVVLERLERGRDAVRFATRSGVLAVERDGERYAMDLPARPAARARETADEAEVARALGARPLEVRRGPYWMAVLASEADVRALRPDFARLAALETPVIATAPGDEVDFVSRFFAPALGVPEDPVTGSAHCTSAPYWFERLGRRELVARQLSARGGELRCVDAGERVRLVGDAVLYLEGSISIGA